MIYKRFYKSTWHLRYVDSWFFQKIKFNILPFKLARPSIVIKDRPNDHDYINI